MGWPRSGLVSRVRAILSAPLPWTATLAVRLRCVQVPSGAKLHPNTVADSNVGLYRCISDASRGTMLSAGAGSREPERRIG